MRDTTAKPRGFFVAHHSMKMRVEIAEIFRAAQRATLNK
jgi:hypothetical protein